MSENPIRLQLLFRKYVGGQLTPAELDEFWTLMADYNERDLLDGDLQALWEKERGGIRPSDSVNWGRVEERLQQQIADSEIDYDQFKVKRMQWWKYVAAAVVIGVIVFAGKQLFAPKAGHERTVAKTDIVAPDRSRAMITLEDGKSVIYLDQIAKGSSVLAVNGVKVVKLSDGSVRYEGGVAKDGVIAFNTFSNPRGSRAQRFVMDDGTAIWLNAGSTIRYQAALAPGRPRRAELLEGEVFLDVQHDERSPFTLKVGTEQIEDLGTSFNVNAYNPQGVKTTLIDGALRVNAQAIRPGEQYVKGQISRPELEQVTAWKNGQFSFQEASVEEIMKQAGSWYDMEIVMDGPVHERFSFSVDRTKPVSALLKAMELSGGVHFEIEGRTVRVRP